MILQIRATSGGGKTTLMRYLMDLARCKPFHVSEKGKPLIYRGDWQGYRFYVIGPYDKEGTGGCDRISEISQVIELVDMVAAKTHASNGNHTAIVCFEGLLLAHSWGAMGEHLHEQYSERYMNAFIDTSVEQCYANVLKRRPDNTDETRLAKIKKNVVADHYRVELAHKRVLARGGRLVDVPYAGSGPFMKQFICDWVETQEILYGN